MRAVFLATLFTIFEADVTASSLRTTRQLVTGLIGRELRREELPAGTFGDLEQQEVLLAKTADRSVLGCMNIWSIWASVVPGPDGPWCSLVWLACADGLASGSAGLASAPGVRHFAAAVGIKELPNAAEACTATE